MEKHGTPQTHGACDECGNVGVLVPKTVMDKEADAESREKDEKLVCEQCAEQEEI